ncbi:MAG TPA: hypothetical protein VK425_09855 [Acidimicrobiales bacterium]|nr:hypothetical protein [Acidimicrobiales bacterium]
MSDSRCVIFVVLPLAPAVMLLAAAAERRLGPSAAGWVAALPVAFAVAATGVDLGSGGRAAATMALSAAGHVPAQIAFASSFAAVLRRLGLLRGVVAGTASYALVSLLVGGLGPVERVVAAVVALFIGPRLICRARPASVTVGDGRPLPVVMSCASAALVVAMAMLATSLAGPAAAGTIAAFPTMSAALASVVGRRRGRQAAIDALYGLTRSLPCYFAFCLVVGLVAPTTPLPASIAVALATSIVTASFTWRAIPTPGRPLAHAA